MKTKKVTISLTAEQQQQAKEISKQLLGNQTISGFFAYWINQHLKNARQLLNIVANGEYLRLLATY